MTWGGVPREDLVPIPIRIRSDNTLPHYTDIERARRTTWSAHQDSVETCLGDL